MLTKSGHVVAHPDSRDYLLLGDATPVGKETSVTIALMLVVSVNVGMPREVVWKRQRVSTAIFKEPVKGTITVRKLNLDGDRQADLTVHGGPDKAVYAYPLEHYEYWRMQVPEMPATLGAFGENLTTRGVLEMALAASGICVTEVNRRAAFSHLHFLPNW